MLDKVGDTDASSMDCRKLLGHSNWKSFQSSSASTLHCEFCSSKIWNISNTKRSAENNIKSVHRFLVQLC